ncbi:MAG: phosphatase domain-containing protein [Shimia sp.]
MRQAAIAVARLVERGLERIGRKPGPPVLDPYVGYATPEGWVVRGRVLTHLKRAEYREGQSRWRNARQMLSLFITDEVEDVPVRFGATVTRSDAEGYIAVTLPPQTAEHGWGHVLGLPGAPEEDDADRTPARFPVRVPGPEAARMVISDIDDTVIETGAHSLRRNLWTTFTGAGPTRHVHADARALMARLTEGGHPVYYVSSSPWNMHHFLQTLFESRQVPQGPMFLRDLGLSGSGGIGESHLDHKSQAIDTILAAQPRLPAILLGDSGQKDAKVYLAAIERHPGRIEAVALREPAEGVGRDDAAAFARIEALGVPCYHGATFAGAEAHWAAFLARQTPSAAAE